MVWSLDMDWNSHMCEEKYYNDLLIESNLETMIVVFNSVLLVKTLVEVIPLVFDEKKCLHSHTCIEL